MKIPVFFLSVLSAGGAGLTVALGASLTGACFGVTAAGEGTAFGPIERFELARTSALAFSIIAFCFSSVFARMGTKSSGIGLLSYKTN